MVQNDSNEIFLSWLFLFIVKLNIFMTNCADCIVSLRVVMHFNLLWFFCLFAGRDGEVQTKNMPKAGVQRHDARAGDRPLLSTVSLGRGVVAQAALCPVERRRRLPVVVVVVNRRQRRQRQVRLRVVVVQGRRQYAGRRAVQAVADWQVSRQGGQAPTPALLPNLDDSRRRDARH